MRKTIFSAMAAMALVLFTAAPNASAECQPKMIAALEMLKAAEANLQAASADKGGHRVKAMHLIRKAINEVNAGMHFDNRH